jgi:hypothetical protein
VAGIVAHRMGPQAAKQQQIGQLRSKDPWRGTSQRCCLPLAGFLAIKTGLSYYQNERHFFPLRIYFPLAHFVSLNEGHIRLASTTFSSPTY